MVNFSGTDVGAGYAYTEWSTDGGTTWTKGEVASVGGDGEITVTYHGVDKVGIMSANQTIMVKVATTGPSVDGRQRLREEGPQGHVQLQRHRGHPARSGSSSRSAPRAAAPLSTHTYANVTANSDQSRSFTVNLKKGKYNIRISAVDQAGNNQTQRGTGYPYGQVSHDRLHSRRQLQWAGRRKAPRPFLCPETGSRGGARVR